MESERVERFPHYWLLPAAILLSILWALSTVHGQTVEGPDRFDPYKLCEFTAKGEATWSYSWAFYPRGKIDYRESDFGLKTTFVGPPGAYEAELLVTGPTGDEKRPFFIKRVIKPFTIGTPQPGPGPVNPDGPTTVIGRYVIEQLTAASLDKPTAREIAANFGDVCKEAREGRYPNLQTAITSTKERNKATLERLGKYAAWKPVLDRIGQKCGEIVKENSPMPELIAAFTDVQTAALWFADH